MIDAKFASLTSKYPAPTRRYMAGKLVWILGTNAVLWGILLGAAWMIETS